MVGKSSTKWFHILIFASMLLSLAAPASLAGAAGLISQKQDGAPGLLQFTSRGHILGFAADGYYAASGSHALRVKFSGANAVRPVSQGAASRGNVAPLTRVTYPNLWDGISLAIDSTSGGILQTTYTLQPWADPAQIRLGYNAPLEISADGKLVARYQSGLITESAPIAWQQVNGQRVGVEISFRQTGQNEVGFALGPYNPAYALMIDPITIWNTFLGGGGGEVGNGIVVDASNNVYVVGDSDLDWGGTPVRAYTAAGYDAFVAKLDPDGNLVWHTFLGGSQDDYGNGIALDGSGNIYVAGWSDANVSGAWSCPVDCTVTDLNDVDAFVAKLDSSGNLLWNTFTGGINVEVHTGISVDTSGNSFVSGYSSGTWGAPLVAFTASLNDGHAARFNASGTRIWNTFIGGTGDDQGNDITLDDNGDVFVTGVSSATWGTSPVRGYTALNDGFYVKLSPANGARSWHGFLGGSGNDLGAAITHDGNGNLYVAGTSSATWGAPVDAHAGGDDGFAAQIDAATGALSWNTFQGSATVDSSTSIVEDGLGNVFVMGTSDATWGTPVQGHSGATDAFLTKLDLSGNLALNAFLGGAGSDTGGAIAAISSGDVFMLGASGVEWGTPIRPHNSSGNNADAFVAEVDIVAPSVVSFALQSPAASPTNADSLTFRATFNEDVLGVNTADFLANTTSTASVTGAVSVGGSASVYDITLSGGNLASFNGTVGLDVNPATDITDVQGNALDTTEPPTDEIYDVDNTAPGVAVDQAAGQADPTNDTLINFTAVFSEAINPVSFTSGDVTLGGSIGGTSATVTEIAPFDGTTFDIAVSGMSGTGTVTASIGSGVVQDLAGNNNTASTTGDNSVTYDGVAPTVTISSSLTSPTNVSPIPVTFTFSEAVTGFALGDITVGNGAAGNFTLVSSTIYTADITPAGNGAVTVDVGSSAAQDAAGNGSTAASQFSITYDNTAPALNITSAVTDPTNVSPFTATFTFSETVTGFALGDITVGNGAASNFTPVSGTVYTADITPAADGLVTVDVGAGAAQDAAGNNNTAAAQFSVTYDGTPPTVSISTSISDPTNISPFTATFSFSEAVTGFILGDITVGNGAASNFTPVSGTIYTASITPAGDGLVTVDVGAGAGQDSAGNGNTAAAQYSVTYDSTAPTVNITSAITDPTNVSPFTATFTFSETVTGFALGDITVGNGAAGNFVPVSGSVYTADITPAANGLVTVDVGAAVAQDAATNDNTAATQFSVTFDNVAPDVSLDSTPPNPSTSANATFTFSSTDGTASFVCDLDGAGFSPCASPTDYLGLGDGSHTFKVHSVDPAGNTSADATYTWLVDTAPPSVLSSVRADANPTSKRNVKFTVTFSEPVTGVDTTDFTLTKTGAITGYSVTNVTNAGAVYTITVNTGTGNGTLRLDVLSDGSILDAANNPLAAGFTTGQTYTVKKVLTLKSAAASDGWILESAETSSQGGTINTTAPTFRLGDDATNKQYRSILSFITSSLPDNAVITKVTLKIKKQAITGGGNPVTLLQGFMVDVRKGFFGAASSLAANDFQATLNKTVGPSSPGAVNNWYSLDLTSAKGSVNKLATLSGVTQFRLRFKLDDNNDATANFMSFFSGNALAASKPQLIIEYYVP
jgi:hypothetical protein